MRRQDIINEARTWLNTPFRHQGRVKGVGVDCIGLLEGVASAFHLPFEDRVFYSTYGESPYSVALELSKWMKPIHPHLAKIGDVVGLWVKTPEKICHVCILTDIGILHTSSGMNKVTEHGMDPRWKERICQGFEFHGIED